MTLFIGPRQGGLEPVMSKVRSSPFLVIFILIVSGASTTPSLSTCELPSYTPSGMPAILARIWRSARWRISAIACFTTPAP